MKTTMLFWKTLRCLNDTMLVPFLACNLCRWHRVGTKGERRPSRLNAHIRTRRIPEKLQMRHGQTDRICPSEAVSHSLASRELVWHKLRSEPRRRGSVRWGHSPQSPIRMEVKKK